MLYLKQFETPLGLMVAAADEEGLSLLGFADGKRLLYDKSKISEHLNDEFVDGENSIIRRLLDEINEYFSGSRKIFTIPLVLTGTQFQNRVWNNLLKVPYGSTRSYMDETKASGNPASIRAIAGANSKNRISIIIPCHRIIGENGKLTGYSGGLWRKQWLIEHEKRHSGQPVSQLLF